MAKQKKIDISLTVTEAQHLRHAAEVANSEHYDQTNRPNPALKRVVDKLDKAQALADSVDLEPVRDGNADAAE